MKQTMTIIDLEVQNPKEEKVSIFPLARILILNRRCTFQKKRHVRERTYCYRSFRQRVRETIWSF